MNIFRGLLDLISGKPKPDAPPSAAAGGGESLVPTLKEILSELKNAKPPSESRGPLPPVPTPQVMQSNPPPESSPPAGSTPAAGSQSPIPPKSDNSDGLGRLRDELQAIAQQHREGKIPPAPTGSDSPAPAPVVNVESPTVNVAPAAAPQAIQSGPMGDKRGTSEESGMLSGFVAKLGESFQNLITGLGNLISGIPRNQANQQPPQSGAGVPSGVPPAPSFPDGPSAGNWKRGGGGGDFGNTKGGDFQPPKPPEGDSKAKNGILKSVGSFVKLAGVVSLVTGVFGGILKSFKSFAKGTHEANKELRNYSGQLAVAFAQLDIQELQQKMQLAQRTGGSGADLAEQMKKMKTESQPLKEMTTSIKNRMAANYYSNMAALAKITNDLSQMVGLVDVAKDIEKNTRDNSRDNREPGVRMAQELASGRWTQLGIDGPLPPIQ